jgi:prepilin-type N-terminal cleavage/methylation domain-containing protein
MKRGDDGVTLIELLVCLAIMGVVASALAVSFLASTRSINDSGTRMADTHDSEMASSLFSSDTQSSSWVWTATPPFPFQSCGSSNSLVTFAWIGSNSGAPQTNVAAYQAIDQGGEHQLVRQLCTGSGFSTGNTPTSSVIIAHNLYGTPTVSCLGPGNAALSSCDGQNVTVARLTATAQSSATDSTGFQYVLQATRRPTPTQSTTPPSTPAFVQATSLQVTSGTTVTVPQTNTAGDLIVAYVVWDNRDTANVTDSNGNTYVAVSPAVPWMGGKSGNANASAQVFYAKNVPGGNNIITATFSTPVGPGGPKPFGLLYVTEYSGIDKTNPLDVTGSANGMGTGQFSSGTVTTTNANDVLVGLGASQDIVTAPGTNYIARLIYPQDPQGNIVEDQNLTSTGTYAATATHNGTTWVMQIVAFRADPGGPPL